MHVVRRAVATARNVRRVMVVTAAVAVAQPTRKARNVVAVLPILVKRRLRSRNEKQVREILPYATAEFLIAALFVSTTGKQISRQKELAPPAALVFFIRLTKRHCVVFQKQPRKTVCRHCA